VNPPAGSYATPEAFRTALEHSLGRMARERGTDLSRLRRLVAIDRLLARLFAMDGNAPWVVTGGIALEARFRLSARATKDLDLSVATLSANLPAEDAVEEILDLLREAAARDLGDSFAVRISELREKLGVPPDGGVRFGVDVSVGERLFDQFQLDVAPGVPALGSAVWFEAQSLLGFAGIAPARFAVIPAAQHFAEKLHAYTRPRGESENSRVRDLVDMALLISGALSEPLVVSAAIEAVFSRWATHDLPARLNAPPETWRERYASLAADTGASARTIDDAFGVLARYCETLECFKRREGRA